MEYRLQILLLEWSTKACLLHITFIEHKLLSGALLPSSDTMETDALSLVDQPSCRSLTRNYGSGAAESGFCSINVIHGRHALLLHPRASNPQPASQHNAKTQPSDLKNAYFVNSNAYSCHYSLTKFCVSCGSQSRQVLTFLNRYFANVSETLLFFLIYKHTFEFRNSNNAPKAK